MKYTTLLAPALLGFLLIGMQPHHARLYHPPQDFQSETKCGDGLVCELLDKLSSSIGGQ